MITTEQIKELRNQTGVSVMQCKKALEEAKGDMEQAIVILRKKSGDIAIKRADKTFAAGTVQAYIHANGNVGAIVELDCETDFVASNEEFKKLAYDIAMQVVATNPRFLNITEMPENDKQSEFVLLEQAFIKNSDMTVKELIDSVSQKFGEKIQVSRFVRFKVLEK